MPELPEVETVRLGITSFFANKKIKDIIVNNRSLRLKVPKDLEKTVINQTIVNIRRRAKYLLLDLTGDLTLIVHLGMAGKIRIIDGGDNPDFIKHDHVIMSFSDSSKLLVYNDSRRFGCFTVTSTSLLKEHKLLKDIGIEPLSDEFDAKYLLDAFKKRSMNVKTALLNQKIIAGIGNIYACEALFLAKISPLRKACDISPKEIEKLVFAIKMILNNAIKKGGTTIRDYQTPLGNLGYFANELAVYNKAGQKCLNCDCSKQANNVIKKIVQNNRSTFYCANCQR